MLYLVRHAMTEANAAGLVLGALDSPLAAAGVQAAKRLAAELAGRGIGRIACSPLGRARETARILGQELGLEPVSLPGLAELSSGVWEYRPRAEAVPQGGSLRSSWNDRPPGGESYADAEPRVAAALAQLAGTTSRDRPVLLVGHAVVNRVVLALLCGLPRPWLLRFLQPHERAILVRPGVRPIWLDTGTPLHDGSLVESAP